MQTKYIISSPQAMIDLGEMLIGQGLYKFGIIGDLGAGKTHFTKGVAKGIGLDDNQVHSPTYVYFHEYDVSLPTAGGNSQKLLHVDMYRMHDFFLIIRSGLQEKLEEYHYQCIEWPKEDWIDTTNMSMVHIEIIDETTRKVIVTTNHSNQ